MLHLLGSLDADYDDPAHDRKRIEDYIKAFNGELEGANVNFSFPDKHHGQQEVFPHQCAANEDFDQIGLFNRHPRQSAYTYNASMGASPQAPD